LKRVFKKALPGLPAKGNEFWKWESKQPPDDSFLTYMSKGTLRPVFLKNYTPEEVDERRKQWKITIPVAPISPKYDEWEVLKKAYDATHDAAMSKAMSLDATRHWTFSWYFRRDGRAPHISNYKRNAISLYLRAQMKKDPESFQIAVSDAINLWY